MWRHRLLLACLLASPIACTCGDGAKGGDENTTGPAAVPSTILGACEHRKAWPKRLSPKCVKCVALARAPACGCPKDMKDYSGKCAKVQRKRLNAAKDKCTDVFACADKCTSTDCGCKDKCLAGNEECHKIYAAVSQCLAEVCEPLCNGDAAAAPSASSK